MSAGLLEYAMEANRSGGPGLGLFPEGLSAYEASRLKRFDGEFNPRGQGPNLLAETWGGLDLVARKWRHLIDNNPVINGIVEHICRNVVGTGIDEIEPDTGFPDVDDQLAEIQETAFTAVDPERTMTLAQSQQLAFREMLCAEVLVHWPIAEAWRDADTGPAIELIEMERIDRNHTEDLGGGRFVRQGVEFDAQKRAVAYHVLRDNPRDGGIGFAGLTTLLPGFRGAGARRIPISDAGLLKFTRRIGEIRGVPFGVSVIGTARLEESYVDDTMALAALASRLGVFFVGGAIPPEFLMKGGKPVLCMDSRGNPVMSIERGAINFLPEKMDLKTAAHNLPGPGFDVGERGLQRRIAVGAGTSYAGASGDYSQGNFSSQRAESLEYRKSYRRAQEQLFFGHTQPWRARLFRWKMLTGELKLTSQQRAEFEARPAKLINASVGYPGWEYVNPSQEAQAAGEDIANGVRSEIEAIQERGGNWKRVVRQRVKFEKFTREERKAVGLPEEEPDRPRNGLALGDRKRGADERRGDAADNGGDQ